LPHPVLQHSMGTFKKLGRYMAKACAQWWRGGLKAVTDDTVAELRQRFGIHELSVRIQRMEQKLNPLVSTWAATNWIEHATLKTTPLVSVILPTYNRSGLLGRAVDSVCAQIYPRWEIIVVDDGSTDCTPAVVQQLRNKLGDDRLQTLRISHSGVCAARNRALARARGEFVVYLDDDNFMAPLWLKAVVWAFSQRPDVDVVYGGIIVDDLRRLNRRDSGDLPAYYLHPFDRDQLLQDNLADIGQIAHRRGLPEARFDETLREMGDWDLLLRLTREKAPLVIPALACFYSTQAPDRLSGGPTYDADAARVREKAR